MYSFTELSYGAFGRSRTLNPLIKSQLLYHLSYERSYFIVSPVLPFIRIYSAVFSGAGAG